MIRRPGWSRHLGIPAHPPSRVAQAGVASLAEALLLGSFAPHHPTAWSALKYASREEHGNPYRMFKYAAAIGTLGRPIRDIASQPLGGRGEEP